MDSENHTTKASKWNQFSQNNPNTDFQTILENFHTIYTETDIPLVWHPDQYPVQANVLKWMNDLNISDYATFYQWSYENRGLFWGKAISELNISFNQSYTSVLTNSENPDDIIWLKDALFNIVESCFLSEADQTAIIFKSENNSEIKSISYAELFLLVKQYANGLRSENIKRKDRIILYMPFSIEAVASYLALIYMGAEAVLVADSFSSVELKKRIDIVKASAVITSDYYWYSDKKISVLAKVLEAVPDRIILHSNAFSNALSIRNNDRDLLLSDLKKEFSKESIPHYHSAQDTISVLFSSGTTKEPKAILWTAATPIKCGTDGLLLQDIHEKDIVTWTSGMGWMMAPWLIFATFLNKGTIALYSGATTKDFIDFTVNTKVTVLGTIPSVVKLWRAQQFGKIKNWNVRVFSSTGEPSEKDDYLYLMYMNQFKAPVIEYCGGTEIGGGYISNSVLLPNAPSYFNTPAPGGGFVLLDSKKEICKEGESGEVFIIPPSIGLSQHLLNKNHYEEYYEETPTLPNIPATLRKHGDGFAFFLYQGIRYYKSLGRTDDSMNLGGIKVSSVEIEYVINQHPKIRECAAISVQDKNGGPEKLIVFIQPVSTIVSTTDLLKDIQKLIQQQLNPLFRVSEIILKESLPRTASNKIMRKDLKKEYTEKLY